MTGFDYFLAYTMPDFLIGLIFGSLVVWMILYAGYHVFLLIRYLLRHDN